MGVRWHSIHWLITIWIWRGQDWIMSFGRRMYQWMVPLVVMMMGCRRRRSCCNSKNMEFGGSSSVEKKIIKGIFY